MKSEELVLKIDKEEFLLKVVNNFISLMFYIFTYSLLFVCLFQNFSGVEIRINSSLPFEPPREKTNNMHMRKQLKTQISFAVTAKLISAFVFAIRIVHFLFFLNPKFQASSLLP